MKHLAWLLLGALSVASCQTVPERAVDLSLTRLPRLHQQPVSLPPALQQDSISEVWPQFVGRFALADTLVLEHPLTATDADWLRYFAAMRAAQDSATLNTDGLELVVDPTQPLVYQQDVPAAERARAPAQRVLPVFVVNTTARTKLLAGKNIRMFAIQEAQDRQGEWRPIESEGLDFCGNGRWLLKLHPRQLGLFFVQQYEGPFATRLRVRLQNGESRYVSAPYPGYIREQQFLAPAQQVNKLRDNRAAVDWLYYGAEPVALDSLEAQEERLAP